MKVTYDFIEIKFIHIKSLLMLKARCKCCQAEGAETQLFVDKTRELNPTDVEIATIQNIRAKGFVVCAFRGSSVETTKYDFVSIDSERITHDADYSDCLSRRHENSTALRSKKRLRG